MPVSEPYPVLYLDHTAKWSGGEIALLRTLEAIDRTQFTPVVALAEDGPFADRLKEIGVEVHILPLAENLREVRKDSLGGGAFLTKVGAAAAFAGYANTIARFARQRRVAILHCNSLKSDVYGAFAGQVARIPVLWHVRDHIDPTYLPAKAVKGFRAMARVLPQYVITNSESTLQKLFPAGSGKMPCRAIYDGLADRELTIPEPPETMRWKNEVPVVAIVGRLVTWKGQHIFLEAAQRVVDKGIAANFWLIGGALFGETDYEARLKEIAAPLGEHVKFFGFRSNVSELLQKVDIMVHASITPEPFGQVVIEAMAEGVPVIGSDGGGVREIITPGKDGLLAPMGDAEALANELVALLKDPVRANRLARAGHRTVRERFTAAHNARQIEEVYREMLAKRRTGAGTRQDNSTSIHREKV
ncbi:MAG: glycosyltransferase family 4 protein [Armatimonadaceae bacterium]